MSTGPMMSPPLPPIGEYLLKHDGNVSTSNRHRERDVSNRRGLLLGLASALAAPAIVHAGNLMAIKPSPRKILISPDWEAYEWRPVDGSIVKLRRFVRIKYHFEVPTDSEIGSVALAT